MCIYVKIWRALFSLNTGFEICTFALWRWSEAFLTYDYKVSCLTDVLGQSFGKVLQELIWYKPQTFSICNSFFHFL